MPGKNVPEEKSGPERSLGRVCICGYFRPFLVVAPLPFKVRDLIPIVGNQNFFDGPPSAIQCAHDPTKSKEMRTCLERRQRRPNVRMTNAQRFTSEVEMSTRSASTELLVQSGEFSGTKESEST